MCIREDKVTTISNLKTLQSSGRSARSISYSIFWIKVLSNTIFNMDFNRFSIWAGSSYLFFNSVSSSDLRDKQCFFIWILNLARRFFFLLYINAESEDSKGIPSFVFPITDDLVFFRYHFVILQMDNDSWSRIY